MPRTRKDYENFTIKLNRELSKRLTDYCEKEYRTKTATVEMLLAEFLDQYEATHKDPKDA